MNRYNRTLLATLLIVGAAQLHAVQSLPKLWATLAKKPTNQAIEREIYERMTTASSDPRDKLELTKYLFDKGLITYNTINSALAYLALRNFIHFYLHTSGFALLTDEQGKLYLRAATADLPVNPRELFLRLASESNIQESSLRENVLAPEIQKTLENYNASNVVRAYINRILTPSSSPLIAEDFAADLAELARLAPAPRSASSVTSSDVGSEHEFELVNLHRTVETRDSGPTTPVSTATPSATPSSSRATSPTPSEAASENTTTTSTSSTSNDSTTVSTTGTQEIPSATTETHPLQAAELTQEELAAILARKQAQAEEMNREVEEAERRRLEKQVADATEVQLDEEEQQLELNVAQETNAVKQAWWRRLLEWFKEKRAARKAKNAPKNTKEDLIQRTREKQAAFADEGL